MSGPRGRVLDDDAVGNRMPDRREREGPAPAAALQIDPIVLPQPLRGDVARRVGLGLRVAARHFPPAIRTRTRGDVAHAMRRVFEDLGGTFSKFGQLIGSSPGLFGDDVAAEFRGFLDAGAGVPFPLVRDVVEEELGAPLHQLFESFDPLPLAAASLAVVHRATLPGGRAVAVKVLRPGVEHRIATDIAVMRPLFNFIGRQVAVGIAGTLPGLVDGLSQQVAEELDLRNEARALAWFAGVLEQLDVHVVEVPAVVAERSSRRVLTMALLDGVPVDDADGIAALGVDAGPLLQECLRVWFAATLCTGMFHGDIHAGNVFVRPGGTLALFDWGIVGRFDDPTRLFFRRCVEGVLGDEGAWADVADHLSAVYGDGFQAALGMDDDGWRQFVRNQVEPIFVLPFGQVDLRTMLIQNNDPALPAPAARTNVERVRNWWAERRRQRILMESQGFGGGFDQATFLLSKQLVYFERYGKLFLPDTPLLYDRDVFRALLALPLFAA